MKKHETLLLSSDDAKLTIEEINESQFTRARLRIFSDGFFSPGNVGYKCHINEETLRKAEDSVLGKPLLWGYSKWDDDCTDHAKDEAIAGIIPETKELAQIEYEYDEELGKTFMVVNCYILKLYAPKLVEIFERDGIKDVSCEMWILDKEEMDGYTEIKSFLYTGCTILGTKMGKKVNPACKGATMEVIKFSQKEYDSVWERLKYELNNNASNEPTNSGSFLLQNNKKEDVMEETQVIENSTQEQETVENATAIVTDRISISQDAYIYDDNGNYIGDQSEYHSKTTTVKVDIQEDTTVENSEVVENKECLKNEETEVAENSEIKEEVKCSAEDLKAMELKCSEQEVTISDLKAQLEAIELKCSGLEEYKKNIEDAQKVQAIECALSDVADVLTTKQISDWREKSLNCSSVDAFTNELKAFAYDVKKTSGTVEIETLRNSISNIVDEESGNVWDRLRKSI